MSPNTSTALFTFPKDLGGLQIISVPHAARDPKILKDRNLENEDILELIKNPPDIGAVRISEFLNNLNSGINLCAPFRQ